MSLEGCLGKLAYSFSSTIQVVLIILISTTGTTLPELGSNKKTLFLAASFFVKGKLSFKILSKNRPVLPTQKFEIQDIASGHLQYF